MFKVYVLIPDPQEKSAVNSPQTEQFITYPNGDKYRGEVSSDCFNQQRCGFGVLQYTCGDRYEGEWKDDLRNGYGVFSYGNTDVYSGEYLDDIPHGSGTMLYTQFCFTYIGQWREGVWEGRGLLTFDDGEVCGVHISRAYTHIRLIAFASVLIRCMMVNSRMA